VNNGILHALLECAAVVLPDIEQQEWLVEKGVFKIACFSSSYKTQIYDCSNFSFTQWEVTFSDFSRLVARLTLSFSNLFNCDIFFDTVVSSFSKMYGAPSLRSSMTVFDNSSIVVQHFVHFHQELDTISQIQSFGSLICPADLSNHDRFPRELCLLNAVIAMSRQKWEFLHKNFSSLGDESKYTVSTVTQESFELHMFAELASRSEGAWFTPIERLSWSNIYQHRLKSFQEGRILGLHQSGILIGTVEMSQACPKGGVLFNFISVLPQFRKQGYAHHLIKEVQKYVFENNSASSLLSFVSVQNIPSMRAFMSNGWSCVAWVYAKLL
jgi:hypothetical protein